MFNKQNRKMDYVRLKGKLRHMVIVTNINLVGITERRQISEEKIRVLDLSLVTSDGIYCNLDHSFH